jgi:cytochrome c oxidase assembly protein subunit 15
MPLSWIHYYARLLAVATLLLVAAGGMVTSTQSGLAVPDWPTTYGQQMFSFPLSQMVGGIFYEHGHRLIASVVGMLTIGLAALLWWREPRRWVRRLGFAALGTVILQGVLGGITVLYFLPDPVSIGHAGLAQIFFCLTVAIALFTSRTWQSPASPPVDDPRLRQRLVLLTGLVYAQILIGATMRHTGAGLAIPDFPLVFGGLWPPAWTTAVSVHYAHRVGALVVTLAAFATMKYIWSKHADRRELIRPVCVLFLAVAVQVTLGALVILTGKQPMINTLHVAGGAIVLATSVVLTLRAYRVRFGVTAGAERAVFTPPRLRSAEGT